MRSTIEDGVIIFDEVSLVRHRMNNLLQGYNVHVYEVSQEIELFNILANVGLKIGLVIMDVGNDANKGFRILSKIKEKRYDVPVFILTSNNKREVFARGIAEGASDYILKPFEDTYLLEKVLFTLNKKHLMKEIQVNSNSEIVFDIQSYLNTEFKKAQKGKYDITVLMSTFFLPINTYNNEIENKYIQVSDMFYHKFKSDLWDTDIFERYGSQIFIGIFPYCGLDNVGKVQKKIKDSFEAVKKGKEELESFHLAISTITYPSESEDTKGLLFSLGLRMKNEIDNIKKNIVP
ncbi:MAG: transcriptional regulator [Herbinix sp.]|nr:transcriptional regulator [Herbinix sp.]